MDLPVWQALYTELAARNFVVITVAMDTGGAADAAQWIEAAAPTHPSLIDIEHRVAELYDWVNVPSIAWIVAVEGPPVLEDREQGRGSATIVGPLAHQGQVQAVGRKPGARAPGPGRGSRRELATRRRRGRRGERGSLRRGGGLCRGTIA